MTAGAAAGELGRFRMDAARWVVAQQVADPTTIRARQLLALLWRHPPLRAMAWFRLATVAVRGRVPLVPGLVQRHLLFRYGLEMVPGVDVGGGLYIAHPVGCVLFADRIGTNVTVIAGVTFGMRGEPRWPTIGDDVFVGAGARVLGGITVGDGASVGANAVVLHDVDPGDTVVGVPARPLRRPTALRAVEGGAAG